ncbi:ORF-10 [Teiidae poxvirus 1]|nr:ORF-10 [Teiidae poxvirus 1]
MKHSTYLKAAIHKAVKTKNINEAKFLIANKFKRVNKGLLLSSALYFAVNNSDLEMVRLLLENDADINKCGKPPLHRALHLDNTEIAKLLVDYGANVETVHAGYSPLYISLSKMNMVAAKYLLDKGASPNRLFINFGNTLYGKLSIEAYRILIDYNVNVNIRNKHGCTPIYYAIRRSNKELVELFLINGVILNQDRELYLTTALLSGCSLDIIRLLINYGANVNEIDDFGRTPLHHSICKGYHDITRLLVTSNALLDVEDNYTGSPLYYSVYKNDVLSTKLLIRNGADVNKDNILNIAISCRNRLLVEILLNNGADAKKERVIHKALDVKDLQILTLILQHGANPDAYNSEGLTPLYVAVTLLKIEFTKVLLEYGADPNKPTLVVNNTPLHNAVLWNRKDSIEMLLLYGANLNVVNNYGYTPLSCMEAISDKIATLLISWIILKKDNSREYQENVKFINNNERFYIIKEECINELNVLENIRLSYDCSLAIFLDSTKMNLLVKLVNHPNVKRLRSNIKIYRKIIQKNKNNATHRSCLLTKAVEFSEELCFLNELSVDLRYMIFEMLDNADLDSTIRSCELGSKT